MRLTAPQTGSLVLFLEQVDGDGTWYLLTMNERDWRDEELDERDIYDVTIRSGDGARIAAVHGVARYDVRQAGGARCGSCRSFWVGHSCYP
jgi:hypothetical protein